MTSVLLIGGWHLADGEHKVSPLRRSISFANASASVEMTGFYVGQNGSGIWASYPGYTSAR